MWSSWSKLKNSYWAANFHLSQRLTCFICGSYGAKSEPPTACVFSMQKSELLLQWHIVHIKERPLTTFNINPLAPGEFEWNFRHLISKQISMIDGWGISYEIAPNMNVNGLHWWSVNIGLGNGLVLSGNKPLPEPMLTQISVTIRTINDAH